MNKQFKDNMEKTDFNLLIFKLLSFNNTQRFLLWSGAIF